MAKTQKNNVLTKDIHIPIAPRICRACLSTENLLRMDKLVKVELQQVAISDLYRHIMMSSNVQIPENVTGLICQDCIEKFKFIYVFLKKCERNFELYEQYSSPKVAVVPKKLMSAKRRKVPNQQPAENVSDKLSHLCFLCNQSFSTYQALYKHNKVHRPMRCGGGQECKHCRKKFFSEDTLRNHEETCGTLDNYLEADGEYKDEIVVENSMLIKSEQLELPPIEPSSENQLESIMHIKTEIEDFV